MRSMRNRNRRNVRQMRSVCRVCQVYNAHQIHSTLRLVKRNSRDVFVDTPEPDNASTPAAAEAQRGASTTDAARSYKAERWTVKESSSLSS